MGKILNSSQPPAELLKKIEPLWPLYLSNKYLKLDKLKRDVGREQCDQIWRNFATWATFYESLSNG